MDAMVTARVPVEIKRQGDAKLRDLGSSVTGLVNAAYEYVIATGRLPEREAGEQAPERTLSAAQRAELRSFFDRSSAPAPEGFWDGFTSYKDLIAEGRFADYEALG